MSSEITNAIITDILTASFPEAQDIEFTRNSKADRNQHYSSVIAYVSMKYKRNHKNHQLDLTIKIPREKQHALFFEEMDFYIREALVYDEMLPHVNESLDYLLAPMHYHTIDSRIFVFEDLSRQGYECRDKQDSLNLEQSNTVLKTLSHFHAATYKIHQTHPHLLSEPSFQRSAVAEVRLNMAGTWASPLSDLLRKKGASNLSSKFARAVSSLHQDDDIIYPIVRQSNFDFVVLNHGDFRISNVMFKYSSKDTIESVKIIDFQTCVWCSPAADVIYFITQSVDIDIAQEHFHTLVDWYLQCLNEKLRDLDCVQTYTKDNFMEDLNKLKFFTLVSVFCTCSMMSLMDRSQCEAAFMVDEKEKTSSSHASLEDERFQHVLYGWLKFCEQMGIFDVDGPDNPSG